MSLPQAIRPHVPARADEIGDMLMRSVIADELDRIRQVLEDMGVGLCGDPQIVRSHMEALQTIDELCQRNENLARTLRAPDMAAAVPRITLDTLRRRLHAAFSGQDAAPAGPVPCDEVRASQGG
jgi:hypothetical protein